MMTSFQALAWVSWSLSWMVKVCFGPMSAPLGVLTVAMPICVPHVLELHALLDQLRRIDLDPYGGRLLAADTHERDARDLAEVLGENIFGRVVDVDDGHDVRLDR